MEVIHTYICTNTNMYLIKFSCLSINSEAHFVQPHLFDTATLPLTIVRNFTKSQIWFNLVIRHFNKVVRVDILVSSKSLARFIKMGVPFSTWILPWIESDLRNFLWKIQIKIPRKIPFEKITFSWNIQIQNEIPTKI